MRKYTGKYPNRICTVSGSFAPGIALVETNNGAKYFLHARDTQGAMPTLSADIFDYKFHRAQPQTFRQDVTNFYRVIDDYEVEFFTITPLPIIGAGNQLSGLEQYCGREFVKLMAKQDVLVRFK